MFGLGRRNDEVLYGVLIDIGSGSVGVAVVESNATEKEPVVIFAHRVFMRVTKRARGPEEHIRQIREALFSASLILTKDGIQAIKQRDPHALPDHILVTSSSPWSHILARTIHYSQNDPMKVTEDLLKDLLSSAETEIDDALQKNDALGSRGFTVVERATVDVKVNDYEVKHPLGLSGTEISLSHVTGLVPKTILDAVYEVRDKLFPRCPVHAHTSMLVSFTALRDLMPQLTSFVVVDVTGEGTEIGVVMGGVLLEVVYVPYGSNTLIRSVMSSTGKTPGDAAAYLVSSVEGHLTDSVVSDIEVMSKEFDEAFSGAVSELRSAATFPDSVFVTAHKPLDHFFTKRADSVLSSAIGRKLRVVSTSDAILGVSSDSLNRDVYLTILGTFFHKMHHCGELEES